MEQRLCQLHEGVSHANGTEEVNTDSKRDTHPPLSKPELTFYIPQAEPGSEVPTSASCPGGMSGGGPCEPPENEGTTP